MRRGGQGRGDHERYDAAALLLLEPDIVQPAREERVAVVEVAGGRAEDLDVAGPAHALVALRAVGRDGEEVALHAPHDVLVEPVEQVGRRVEPPCTDHVRPDHLSGDGCRVQRARPALDRRVPEAVERELRRPLLVALACQHVRVRRLRQPQRARAELAVLEDLGMAERDDSALGTVHPDPQSSDQVLSEVEQRDARRGGGDLLDRDGAGDTYRRSGPRRSHDRVPHRDRFPGVVVEAGVVPAGLYEPGVVVLAGVDARGEGRRVGGPAPPGAGRERLAGAVGVRDVQSDRDLERSVPDPTGLVMEAVALPVPAGRESDPECVVACLQEAGDVRGVVQDTQVVRGPARLEDLVVDVDPADRDLVDAVRRGVEARGDGRRAQGELGAEQRRHVVVGDADGRHREATGRGVELYEDRLAPR